MYVGARERREEREGRRVKKKGGALLSGGGRAVIDNHLAPTNSSRGEGLQAGCELVRGVEG